MTPLWKIKNKVVLGCMEELLPLLPEKSVDVTVTSPPYKDCDGYSALLMVSLFKNLFRAHKDKSYLFVNFGHLVAFKARPAWIVLAAVKYGWQLHETIIWVKTQFTPSTSDYNLNNLFESIFMFRKGEPRKLDRLALGVPYADKSNIKRYGRGKDLRCGGNVWQFGYDTVQSSTAKSHPHCFPAELPRRCLSLVSPGLPPQPLVCDPFGGSFTTAAVAKAMGMDFVSCERERFHAYTAAYQHNYPVLNLSRLKKGVGFCNID